MGGTVKPETRSNLKLWLYDDMCHLKPYAEKKQNRETSNISEIFASLSKAVDKFHFVGHKKSDVKHSVSLFPTFCEHQSRSSTTTGCRTGYTAICARWSMTSLARWRLSRMTWSL